MAIVDLDDAESQKPIFAYREQLKVSGDSSRDASFRVLKSALLAAALEYSQSGLKALRAHNPNARVEQVLFVYGAPWARTATRFIRVDDPVPFTVSKEQVATLVKEAEAKDEADFKKNEEFGKHKVALIERSVVHTAINGYLTAAPYDKKANELSLAHISGLIPEELLALSYEIEDKLMPHAKRHTHTFALSLFCVVRDMYPDVAQGLLIDISGEATELSVMQDEILIESATVPCGAYTLLRQVADDLKTMPDEALMHLREYGDKTPKKIKGVIENATKVYTTCLEEALHGLKTKYVLPHTVFLIVNKNLDTFFAEIMDKAMEPYYKTHGVFYALNKVLRDLDKVEPSEPYDAFLGIESRFFHKRHSCGEM